MEKNETKKTFKEWVEEKTNIVTEKVKKGVNKVKETGKSVKDFLVENPFIIMPIVAGITTIAAGAAGIIAGSNNDDQYISEDDLTGEDLYLKHPLTNDEILELGEKMSDGKSKGEALDEMELLRDEKKRKKLKTKN